MASSSPPLVNYISHIKLITDSFRMSVLESPLHYHVLLFPSSVIGDLAWCCPQRMLLRLSRPSRCLTTFAKSSLTSRFYPTACSCTRTTSVCTQLPVKARHPEARYDMAHEETSLLTILTEARYMIYDYLVRYAPPSCQSPHSSRSSGVFKFLTISSRRLGNTTPASSKTSCLTPSCVVEYGFC